MKGGLCPHPIKRPYFWTWNMIFLLQNNLLCFICVRVIINIIWDEELILVKHYTPAEYPNYDNYNAINVNKVVDIPCDYNGIMGVPITFMYKYSPDQFEIVNALNRYVLVGEEDLNEDIRKRHSHACNINGKATYFRVLIRNKHPEGAKL